MYSCIMNSEVCLSATVSMSVCVRVCRSCGSDTCTHAQIDFHKLNLYRIDIPQILRLNVLLWKSYYWQTVCGPAKTFSLTIKYLIWRKKKDLNSHINAATFLLQQTECMMGKVWKRQQPVSVLTGQRWSLTRVHEIRMDPTYRKPTHLLASWGGYIIPLSPSYP